VNESHRIAQVARRTILQQVSVRAGAQGPPHGVLLAADREDDELGGATGGAQLAHDFAAIHARHLQVEDSEIRLQPLDQLERFQAVGALAQNAHALGLAKGGESLANDGMIVGQHHRGYAH
jgi:hypothetical protein